MSISARFAGALVAVVLAAGCGKPAAPTTASAPSGPGPAPAPAPFHALFEAEALAPTPPMQVVAESGTSGGKCVRIPAGLDKNAPATGHLQATITLPKAADVTFWFRVNWSGTCANSYTLTVPGYPDFIVGEDATFKAWHWIKLQPLSLPAGATTITLAQREEDTAIDQILVTADSSYVPMGIEN